MVARLLQNGSVVGDVAKKANVFVTSVSVMAVEDSEGSLVAGQILLFVQLQDMYLRLKLIQRLVVSYFTV